MLSSVTAYANANIALIKYWGKLDAALNLPEVGSLSLTLDCFGTQTQVKRSDGPGDRFTLDGQPQSGVALERVVRFLDLVRELSGLSDRFLVKSLNTVPTAAGLASSSSGFAALALSASQLAGLSLSKFELSQLARQGSGSAARSLWGGFSAMDAPVSLTDEVGAYPVLVHGDLDVRMVVVESMFGQKHVSSTHAMKHSKNTSPYYPIWVETHSKDLHTAIRALEQNDLTGLGQAMEHSTLKMHACMMASQPSVVYFEPLTIQVIRCVQDLRKQGIESYFTMDAGPHVKVLCRAKEASRLVDILRAIPGVCRVTIAAPGTGARVVEAS